MSVVLAYADDKIAVVASDGRVVDANNDVAKEEYKKIRKINSRTIIGFAGELSSCENIANLLTNPQNTYLINTLYVEDVISFIQKLLDSAPPDMRIGFIICGINKSKQMCLAHVVNHQKPEIRYPSQQEPCYEGLYPIEIDRNRDIFQENLIKYNLHALKAIHSTITCCAQISPSVNDTIYYEVLRIV